MKVIKMYFFFLVINYGNLTYGQVGINTSTPNSTLDVNGKANDATKVDGIIAPRVTGNELKNKDDLYTSSQNGVIVYVTQPLNSTTTTPRTKNVLRSGYYNFDSSLGTSGQWVRMFYNAPTVLSGVDGISAYNGTGITITSSGVPSRSTLVSKTFTLYEKSLVNFTISVPVTNIFDASGSLIFEGSSKMIAVNLLLNGGSFNNYLLTRQAFPFSTSDDDYINGVFQLGSSRSVMLIPGTYSVDLVIGVVSKTTAGISATFGAATDTVLDIIAYPCVD